MAGPLRISLLILVTLSLVLPHSPAVTQALTRQRGVRVRELTDSTFEHDTQAATGQTTGRWLVLFAGDDLDSDEFEHPAPEAEESKEGATSGSTAGTLDIMRNVMAIMSEQVPREFVFARVDMRQNPALKKRFSISRTPTIKYFRDRKMFTLPEGATTRKSIEHFLLEGYLETTAETVPPSPSDWDKLLDTVTRKMRSVNQRLASDPLLLILAGVVVMILFFMLMSLALGVGQRKPPHKPAKRTSGAKKD